ncbi:MAG: prolyl oligopeptidase family serine peptidase [Phycisphaerales bacterium]|nr:prolyl oligopeptidase family serine peptidase [Phycisphaerales bacterium]
MDTRFTQLPKSLQILSRHETLGQDIPSLLVHPNFNQTEQSKVPGVIWMHGRTVNKELDPGRYQRWVRHGIGAIAIDLPGHGERFQREYMSPAKTLDLIEQGCREIDDVLESIEQLGIFDMDRLAIGGMSAGGMVTLCKLCDDHPFIGAAVEGTTGNLRDLYFPKEQSNARSWPVEHDPAHVSEIDPIENLASFKPIPLLALHNEGDSMVPISTQREFLSQLETHYIELGADSDLIEFHTFNETGAPEEHAGFGRYANEAKNLQLAFFLNLFGMEP